MEHSFRWKAPAPARRVEMTLGDQVRGILQEVLEGNRLGENAKDRLRALIAEHLGHPERALVEHLRAVRAEAEGERELLAG